MHTRQAVSNMLIITARRRHQLDDVCFYHIMAISKTSNNPLLFFNIQNIIIEIITGPLSAYMHFCCPSEWGYSTRLSHHQCRCGVLSYCSTPSIHVCNFLPPLCLSGISVINCHPLLRNDARITGSVRALLLPDVMTEPRHRLVLGNK